MFMYIRKYGASRGGAAYFDSEKWVASFKKCTTKVEVLSKVPNNGALKACVTQRWWDTDRSRQRAARDMFFQLLENQRVLSRLSVSAHAV